MAHWWLGIILLRMLSPFCKQVCLGFRRPRDVNDVAGVDRFITGLEHLPLRADEVDGQRFSPAAAGAGSQIAHLVMAFEPDTRKAASRQPDREVKAS